MSRSPKRLSPEQEYLIYELKKAGNSGSKIERICARGYKEHPPFSVSTRRALEIARRIADERGELYDSRLAKAQPNEAISTLSRRLIHIADRESARLDRKQREGKLDGDQLAKLAGALTRLHTLLARLDAGAGESAKPDAKPGPGGEPEPTQPAEQPGSSWIASAVTDADAEPEPDDPEPPPSLADRPLPPEPEPT